MACGWDPVLPKRGAHGRPRYDLAACRKSGAATATIATDTTAIGRHGTPLCRSRGGAARGEGGWTGTTPNPERGRRKSSPRPTTKLIPRSTTRIEGPRIPAQGVSNPPAMVLPRDDAPSPGLPPTSNATPPRAPPSAAHSPPQRARRERSLIEGRQRCVALSHVSHKSSNGRGGILFYPSGARTDAPLRSRRVSEIGRDTRHARHPTRPTSGDTRHYFVALEGGRRGGSFLGLARAA